ncbi:cache domain-containing protein [Citricoccus sp.]|uniref:cache domain-containing protein n=1 Tax=Citricoccus sp. TaxID=1978372 RepID=UPI0028BEAAB7|nr:cache domain-containing protein [Citricoccus sp.]
MTLTEIAALIDREVEPILKTLGDLSTQLRAAHATGFYGFAQQEEMARQLDGVVRRAFSDPDAIIVGIGVVWEHDDVSGMLWWRADGGAVSRKDHVNNPESDSFYDFTHMEWYEQTTMTDRLVIAGPYVDAWGTDDHALTPALAVHDGAERIGVSAIDLDVYRLTETLARVIAPYGDNLVVVNADEQVVASNRPALTPGERLTPYLERRGLITVAEAPIMRVDGWTIRRLAHV